MSFELRTHGRPPKNLVARTLWAWGCSAPVHSMVDLWQPSTAMSAVVLAADQRAAMLPLALVAGHSTTTVAQVAARWVLELLRVHRGALGDTDAKLVTRALEVVAAGAHGLTMERVALQLVELGNVRGSGLRDVLIRAAAYAANIGACTRPEPAAWPAEQAGERVQRALELYVDRWERERGELVATLTQPPELVEDTLSAIAIEALATPPPRTGDAA